MERDNGMNQQLYIPGSGDLSSGELMNLMRVFAPVVVLEQLHKILLATYANRGGSPIAEAWEDRRGVEVA